MQLKGLFGTNDWKMKDEGEKYMNGEEWKSKNHRIANTQEWKFDLIGSHEINSMVACSLSNKSTFIMFFQLIFVTSRDDLRGYYLSFGILLIHNYFYLSYITICHETCKRHYYKNDL